MMKPRRKTTMLAGRMSIARMRRAMTVVTGLLYIAKQRGGKGIIAASAKDGPFAARAFPRVNAGLY
jgi:hypothetical protein